MDVDPILDGNRSVFIALTYKDMNDAEWDVEFSTNASFEIEFEDEDGLQLDGNSLNSVLVLFDLDRLFQGVDFSAASADGDGVIRINENSNSAIAATIRSNFKESFECDD
jgi:hypothetical protein